ncbi:MAG: oligosaccharide flippase family protein [Cyclobacteriaceae bacterium]
MGVVIKQSFWNSVWAYAGVGIGFINTLILRPAFLTDSQIGLIAVVTGNALMMAPFVALGMPNTYIRFFPDLGKNKEQERKFLSLQFLLIILANLIFSGLAFLFIDIIKAQYIDEAPEYNQYIFVSILIMALFSLFTHMHAFSRAKLNVIIPGFLKEAYLRILNALLIVLFSWDLISFEQMIYCIILSYLTATLVLGIYVVLFQKLSLTLNIKGLERDWKKKLFKLASFNTIMATCSSIYSNVSITMIPALLGTAANGVYSVCLYIGIVIEMPKRSMWQIITPIVGKEFTNNNLKEVESLYKKASLSLGVIGGLFLIGIITNLSDLFQLIPNGETYEAGFYVVVGVALSKFIDMLFSFNSELLYYTKYYKYNLYFYVIISIIIISLNRHLIPVWGINGAPIAFLISTILFNVMKFILIKSKLGMSPFSKTHWLLLLYAAGTFALFWHLPISSYPLFNIIARSIGITIVFVGLAYFSRLSPDINNLIKSICKKYLNINLP